MDWAAVKVRPVANQIAIDQRINGQQFMSHKNRNLHGSAPDKCETALLIVDVINDFDFPEANQLARFVPELSRRLAQLKAHAKKHKIPVVYVNDNFGRWQSDVRALIDRCRRGKGRLLVERLSPGGDDYFVLKPKHSGFFSSTLETLLRYLRARRLVITGIAGNFCVLFTANDAYMRDFELVIPSDCVVSNTKRENDEALRLMKRYLKADTRPSSRIHFRKGRCSV